MTSNFSKACSAKLRWVYHKTESRVYVCATNLVCFSENMYVSRQLHPDQL